MTILTTIIIMASSFCTIICAQRAQYKIGGVFDSNEEIEEQCFKYAVNMANYNSSVRFNAITMFFRHQDGLHALQSICKLLQQEIIGIFGPSSPIASPTIQSLCDEKDMPMFETHFDTNTHNNVVNVHPHPKSMSKLFIDLVEVLNWRRFVILYEDDESLTRIHALLQLDHKDRHICVKKLRLDAFLTYRDTLNEVKQRNIPNILIDCSSIDTLEEVLKQAQQVGLVNERYRYLITHFDLHTINLGDYQYSGSNVTGVRLVNPEHSDTIDVAEYLYKIGKSSLVSHLGAWKITTRCALIIDAVNLYYNVLDDMNFVKKAEKLYCNQTSGWGHGSSLINFMKTKNLHGLTGDIKFDNERHRSEFHVDLVELTSGGLIKVGEWNATQGVRLSRKFHDVTTQYDDQQLYFNKSFTVITALTPPYGMLKETTTQLTGNDRFEGFSIDLIQELSRMLGFNYTFIIQEDGANGNYNRDTKQWNGMIREIIDGRADLAITDLTITSERQGAVDFTMPFMNLGISILYRKPKPVAPSLFTFASPFSLQVWLLLGFAYFFVSFSLFVIGRLCPKEWINPYPCIEEPEFLINQYSLRNSLWFTIGSLMQQGTEIAPIGVSTRMLAGVWWFFTLIMVSSYTANLAAFLTIETLITSFKNIDELAEQVEIKYGAKAGGATSNFFRDSDIEAYKTIWRYMRKHPNLMTADNDEGVRRVENENYAFLMESTTIEYITERHCTLAQVGGLLDDKGYGIAMKKDSIYRNSLSAAVLKLQETGKLTQLKIRWWKEKRGGGNCASRSAGGAATPLGLKNVEGVFFILLLGTLCGVCGTFIELAVHIYRKHDKANFKEHFISELKFAFDPKQRKTKPVPTP